MHKNVPILFCVSVVVLSMFLFFFQLGSKPFWDYDEALYANVIQDTLKSGELLTLSSNGSFFTDKPPLSFWIGIGVDSIFNHPEFSYRFAAALAGVISVILVMLITYELTANWFYAGIAGLILVTTAPFLQAGREFRLDVPAVASVLFAAFCFLRGLKNPRWFLGIGVGLAIGFFFKNVIGFLSLPFLFWWSVVHKDFRWLKDVYVWLGGVLFLIIFLPWHIYQILLHGEYFFQSYFLHNLFTRFQADLLQQGSYTTGDYLTFFLTYGAPWSLLFAIVIAWLFVEGKRVVSPERRSVFAVALTTVSILLLFLILKTKILAYLVPVYPFVAITLGVACVYFFPKLNTTFRRVVIAGGLFVLALWISISYAFHFFPITAVNDIIVKEEKDVAIILKNDTKRRDVYTYEYDYYDTIVYYSGRKDIQAMKDDQELGKPFFLIVSKPYMDWHSFPEELAAHLSIEYKGQVLILYAFKP